MNGQFDFGGITPTRYFFSIAVVLGLLFAFVSSEQEQPVLVRLLQWQCQTLIPMALLVSVHMGLLRIGVFARLNAWTALAGSGVIGASLFTPIALALDLLIEAESGVLSFDELAQEWFGLTPPIALSWIAINAPWVLGYKVERATDRQPPLTPESSPDLPSQEPEIQPDLMKLVEPDKAGEILYMKSELHYLLVVTSRGKSLILYNLSDAVDQLPEATGMLVHRSYWVAFSAVLEFVKKGRQGELRITDGTNIPVSRTRLQEVTARFSAEQT